MDKKKQKKVKYTDKQKLRKKQKREQLLKTTQNEFLLLYPSIPKLVITNSQVLIGINYKGTILRLQVPTSMQNLYLPYLLHKQIYYYLKSTYTAQALFKTAKVIGFQSKNNDLLLDYQISIGKGIVTAKTTFNCLEYVKDGRLKKYKIYKCLAIGGFSKVYLVRSLKDGQFYAMKVMAKQFITQNQKSSIIQNQRDICSSINHPFLVKLNHCFQTQNFFCFVLDCIQFIIFRLPRRIIILLFKESQKDE